MPNKENFKTHKAYLEYYRKYRKKNAQKIKMYNKLYSRMRRKKIKSL